MWSETIGYRDYRHPYLPGFFRAVAEAIPLTGTEDLLDLGCGVGEVALGFAPFVASLTGMDLEQPMLDALSNRALAMGVNMRLIHSRVEDAPADLGRFHLITMGRAHWFMHTPTSLVRLDQWLMPGGAILVCLPVPNPDHAEWHRVYQGTKNKWVRGNLREMTRLTAHQFFQGTDFVQAKQVIIQGAKQLELEHLVYRALGTPDTSRSMLGAEADEMITAIRAAMTPYFRNGPIMEKHLTLGLIYRRRLARNPEDPTSWGKVSRNETCPCRSGKKFKHCHGRYAKSCYSSQSDGSAKSPRAFRLGGRSTQQSSVRRNPDPMPAKRTSTATRAMLRARQAGRSSRS